MVAGTTADGGELVGRASTFGSVDSYGDRVAPGAYAKTLGTFVQRGFLGWSHQWDKPIGFISWAREGDDGLWIGAKFHSDPEAQRIRSVVKERIEAGRFVGMLRHRDIARWLELQSEGALR